MLGKIKLDLINARLDPNFGPRVFDSLEDAEIHKSEKIKNSFSQISFKSKQPKILYSKRNSFVPNIFDNAVVDCHGNYLDTSMRVHPKVKKEPIATMETDPKFDVCTSKKLFTPTLDKIKDKIHEDCREDLITRVRGKKLPGASWSIVSREERVIPSNTGPGYYEVYESQLSDYNIRFEGGPSGRGESAEFAPSVPIKTRRRLERIEKAKEAEMALKRSASSSRNRDEKNESGEEFHRAPFTSPSSGGIIKFSDAARFDAPEYKQEPYLKTSGFILSPNFDKSFNKKITFTMRDDSEKKTKKNESLTGNVDVDAGYLFSTTHVVKQSRIKYAAAFKSKAKVGMEIPPTVSPEYIGPGSFPGAFPPAVVIKEPHKPSLSFQRERKFYVPPALGDSCVVIKPFAEANTAGPIFNKEGASFDKNAQLAKIVREKMEQIYPRLAVRKFGG
eukprot:gene25244-32940_t